MFVKLKSIYSIGYDWFFPKFENALKNAAIFDAAQNSKKQSGNLLCVKRLVAFLPSGALYPQPFICSVALKKELLLCCDWLFTVDLQDTLRNRHRQAAFKNDGDSKRRFSHQLLQFQCGKFDANQRNINAIDDAASILPTSSFSLTFSLRIRHKNRFFGSLSRSFEYIILS